jgi:hypothetical protein
MTAEVQASLFRPPKSGLFTQRFTAVKETDGSTIRAALWGEAVGEVGSF